MILDKNKFDKSFFDEKIFMYLENDDLCLRIRKANEKIYIYSKSLISHLGGKTVDKKYFNEIEISRNWHWNWSKFYFRKKHYGFFLAIVPGLLTFFKAVFKSSYFFIVNNKFKSKIHYCRASGFINAALNKKSWFRPRLD